MSYARGTLAALVDAVVPETPDLADERGDVHGPGGLADDLDEHLVALLDDFQPVTDDDPLARLGYDAMPLSPVVAGLLDLAALELVVRRRADGSLARSPRDERFAGGPFSRLERRDRLRAVRLLEEGGALARLDDRFHDRLPHLGLVKYLANIAVVLVQVSYYSDWGTDEADLPPRGWEQADYPGPAAGYAVSMGYEVEAFEEDEY